MAGRIAYLGNIVTDGLILDLDVAKQESFNLTGSILKDLSGRQNNGLLISASFTTGSGPETAISFTTGSMYVRATPTFSTLDNNQFGWNPSGSLWNSAITVEVWFKSNQTVFGVNNHLFTKPWNGSGNYNYGIRIASTSSFEIKCRIDSGSSNFVSNVPITDGNWKQFILWINPTQIGYYVNGTQYSGSFTHNVAGTFPAAPGNDNIALTLMTLYPYDSGANPAFTITGSLANVKFYNRQLTQAEVVQNFNAYRTRYGI